MKTRLVSAIMVVLCLGVSVWAQSPLKPYPFKLGLLTPGDMLRITIFKEPYLVTGTSRINLSVNVVIRDDGKMNMPNMPFRNVLFLSDVSTGGLTTSELRQVLEERYAENNYETRVTVQYTGSRGGE